MISHYFKLYGVGGKPTVVVKSASLRTSPFFWLIFYASFSCLSTGSQSRWPWMRRVRFGKKGGDIYREYRRETIQQINRGIMRSSLKITYNCPINVRVDGKVSCVTPGAERN